MATRSRPAGAGWCAKGGVKLPVWATAPELRLEGLDFAAPVTLAFSFHPSGQQQTDVYVALREGHQTRNFLEIAVMPQRIMLFWFRHGTWRTCGTVDYDTPLEVGTTSERKWHDRKVAYRDDGHVVGVDQPARKFVQPGAIRFTQQGLLLFAVVQRQIVTQDLGQQS